MHRVSGPFSEQKHVTFGIRFQNHEEEQCTALLTAYHADDQRNTIFEICGSRLFHISGMKEKQKFANEDDTTVALFKNQISLLFSL